MSSMRKLTALLLACAMILPAAACSNEGSKADSKAENSTAQDSKDELDSNMVPDDENGQNWVLSFDDLTPEEKDDTPGAVTGAVGEGPNAIVTTLKDKDGNIYVPVTDINGVVVTDAQGTTQTTNYTGTTLATTYKDPDWVPDYRSNMAFWLDISKRADFVFDGNLVELEFQIHENTPDGVYPVQIFMTDFSDYNGKSPENIKTNVGYVCVNAADPKADKSLGEGMTLTPETVSAKPGETVRMNIRIDNNTGIAGFRFSFRYDGAAMTLEEAGAGSDLASQAPLTANPIGQKQ